MLSPRAPLFSVSLAFAAGCLLGLDDWIGLRFALVVWAFAGLLWLLLRKREKSSLAAFYLFTACAGLTHALLIARTIDPDDLRRLPDEKTLETTQWRGVIIAEPEAQTSSHVKSRALDRTSFVLRVEAWRPTGGRLFGADIDAPWQTAGGNVRCTVVGEASELLCGDRIEFSSALAPVAPSLCPGGFDGPFWEGEQSIYFHATIPAADWRRTETGNGDWLADTSFRLRDWAYGQLQIGLEDDPRTADFLAGMLIGYRQEIPADIEQDFRRTGTLHVFAVSGQNIAEMLVVVMVALQLCGLVRWRWAWTLAPIVLLYCLLTGSPASAVRATVMALAVLLAWKLGRPLNALGCWSLALLAMLVWNPAILLDPGAQLSFGVVLGLILIAPPLMRIIGRFFAPDPFLPRDLLTAWQSREETFWRWSGALLASGIGATLISEPITAIDFHQVTPISIFANLIVIPTAGLITSIGTMSVFISIFNTPLAALLNNSNWLLAQFLIWFVGVLAHEPGASINVPDLRTLSVPQPTFIVAPVQDSAALLVRTPEGAWLLNTGREAPAQFTTSHLLQFYGVNRLDGLVFAQMSVADNDGFDIIVRDFQPLRLVKSPLSTRSPLEKTMAAAPELSGVKFEPWQRGQSFDLASGVRVDVLNPSADSKDTHAEDRALVLLFHAGGGTLLWAGKIGPQAQAELLAAYPGLHADALVMGTESPPSRAWLEALGVREWLQIPVRDPRFNFTGSRIVAPDSCQLWPLDQTGSVAIHFQPADGAQPPGILLRPWLALPTN